MFGTLIAAVAYDSNRSTPWQALFWVGMVACLGMGAFYAIVWASASDPAAGHALDGLLGCARAFGYIMGARVLSWILATIMGW